MSNVNTTFVYTEIVPHGTMSITGEVKDGFVLVYQTDKKK